MDGTARFYSAAEYAKAARLPVRRVQKMIQKLEIIPDAVLVPPGNRTTPTFLFTEAHIERVAHTFSLKAGIPLSQEQVEKGDELLEKMERQLPAPRKIYE